MTGPAGTVPPVLRLGTRRSALALAQSRLVADDLERCSADHGAPVRVELVEVTTSGDLSTEPLSSFGGVGVFVSALRSALQSGRVDLAVHSLKDLPTAPADGLVLAAVPERADPREALVARDGLDLAGLGQGARIGTGSPRRAAQLLALGTGLEPVQIRGNVGSRIERVRTGEVDAVLLARAGLLRLGRAGETTEVLDPRIVLPAPGQGALAVECLRENAALRALLALLDHRASRLTVHAERSLLARLDAGCSAPVGALAGITGGPEGSVLSVRTVVASPDGHRVLRREGSLPIPRDPPAALRAAEHLGREMALRLLDHGAGDLVPRRPGRPPDPLMTVALTTSQAREGEL